MTKPLPERLREAVKEINEDYGWSSRDCAVVRSIYPDRCKGICSQCDCRINDVLNTVAFEIERDYVPVPDFMYRGGRKRFVELMQNIAREADVVRFEVTTDNIECEHKLTLWYKPKKLDTLSDIESDVTRDPVTYCCSHAEEDVSNWSRQEYAEWMTRDLMRRQREVLGHDAPRQEEKTCENICTCYGDFTCSECGCKATWVPKYCPNCGAKVVEQR